MRSQVSDDQTRSAGGPESGFSLIELLIVVAIILIIAAIAVPNLLRSRQAANQAAAVSNIRTISTAAVSYWVTYGNGYPGTLAQLGGPGPGATCNASVLIDESIAAVPNQKNGYQYVLGGDQGPVLTPPPGCTAGYNGYLATATPLLEGTTGIISYCSSEPGIIHYDTTGATAPDAPTCTALPSL
jgi:type IV pilus assembly protein PilA